MSVLPLLKYVIPTTFSLQIFLRLVGHTLQSFKSEGSKIYELYICFKLSTNEYHWILFILFTLPEHFNVRQPIPIIGNLVRFGAYLARFLCTALGRLNLSWSLPSLQTELNACSIAACHARIILVNHNNILHQLGHLPPKKFEMRNFRLQNARKCLNHDYRQ